MAEFVSSVAVLMTLIYLAIQTNQISEQTELNSAALMSAARQESLNAELELIYQMAASSELMSRDFDSLDVAERGRLTGLSYAGIRIRESLWWQYQNGVLDERTWLSYRGLLASQIANDIAWTQAWEGSKGAYDPDFVREIEALVRQNSDQ